MTEFEKFYTACVEALYFTDTGEDEQPPKDAELADETVATLRDECETFWRRYRLHIDAAGQTPEQAGHDFWLTRNHHGAGFWDGDWPAPYDQLLTVGAESYGEFQTYLGDDGLIYA